MECSEILFDLGEMFVVIGDETRMVVEGHRGSKVISNGKEFDVSDILKVFE